MGIVLIELINDLCHRRLIQLGDPCACAEVVTPETAGGVVMKTGGAASERLAVAKRHTKITNPTAEFSFSEESALRSLTLGSIAG